MEEKWTWEDTKLYSKMLWCIFLDKLCRCLLACAKYLLVCAECLKNYNKKLMKKIDEEQEEEERKAANNP